MALLARARAETAGGDTLLARARAGPLSLAGMGGVGKGYTPIRQGLNCYGLLWLCLWLWLWLWCKK